VSAYHRHDDAEFAKAQGAADERTSTLRTQHDEAAAFNPGLAEQRALFECTDHAGIHHTILPCTEALGQRNANEFNCGPVQARLDMRCRGTPGMRPISLQSRQLQRSVMPPIR
jgi:hypothetical protein